MLVKLRLMNGSQAGATWPVVGSTFLIGRHADCGLRIHNPQVSLHHCSVITRGTEVWVRDLDSTNGTFVNGERLDGECRLGIGDVIKAGPAEFEVLQQTTGVIRLDDRDDYNSTQVSLPPPPDAERAPKTDRSPKPRPRP